MPLRIVANGVVTRSVRDTAAFYREMERVYHNPKLPAIGDVAHPLWRARSVGVYRLWRDAGFAVGALLAGILADLVSIEAAIYAVAALTAVSGVIVIIRMYETHPPAGSKA